MSDIATVHPAWDVPGQAHAVGALAQAADTGDLGHAWAFVGPPGVGQERAARIFAAAANEALDDAGVRGRFLRGAHPAYREFHPVGAFHRKDDVHGLWLDAANATVKEGRVKVLRIVAADKMNPNAANAFLKGLEEPPPGTVWILDIADTQEVPDTILSRCRTLRFQAWTPDGLAELARGLGVAAADLPLVVRAAMGRPDAVRRLADPESLADYRAHRAWLGRIRRQGPGQALVASAGLKREIARRTKAIEAEGSAELDALVELYGDQPPRAVTKDVEERYKRRGRAEQTVTVQQALDDVVAWCRDVLVVAGGGGPDVVRNVDAMDDLRADVEVLPAAALLAICDDALHMREALEVNVRWDLAVESFLLGAYARCLDA